MTLESVGQQFGMTRERARQIIAKVDPTANDRAPKPPAPITFPIRNFNLTLLRWIRESGSLRCTTCKLIEPIDGRKWYASIRCRECNKRAAWAHNNNRPMSEYAPLENYEWLRGPDRRAGRKAAAQ